MYYPDDLIREIRESNDIVSVISEYMTLTKKGSNHFGLCPFHGEKTPSFSVNEREQFFHCFGCGAGGNVFTFVMQMENMTFVETVKHLADRANIALPEVELSPQEKQKLLRKERMLEATKEAARYYYYHLTRTPAGQSALQYLEGRKVTEEFRRKFGLGYAPVSRDGLVAYLTKKGYTVDELLGAGLLSGKDGRVYDRFFNRLMFPIYDSAGRPIAFGGRVMGQGEPKYLNSPESEIFNKRRNLYGMSLAKKSRRDYFLIVEGYMDVLSLHQAGFDNAVASLGTALTKEQSMLIKRYADQVVLCYDSDGAGTNAARRAIPILEEAGLKVKVIRVPGAKDPDEFIKENGAESFEKVIKNAMDPVEFEMLVLMQQNGSDTVEGQVQTLHDMARRLSQIQNDMERELHIRDVAAKMKVSEVSLKNEVEELRRSEGLLEHRSSQRRKMKDPDLAAKKGNAKRQLLAALIQMPTLYTAISRWISEKDFDLEEFYATVAQYVFKQLKAGNKPQLADVISCFDTTEQQEKVSALSSFELPEERAELEKFLTETVRTLKTESIDETIRSGDDLQALQEAINQKRALQTLKITIPG
ncbi:MAG: DNA primase [Firmicutes bacterium]|nr:DNA primase [Bacillota bacterium]